MQHMALSGLAEVQSYTAMGSISPLHVDLQEQIVLLIPNSLCPHLASEWENIVTLRYMYADLPGRAQHIPALAPQHKA